jgi:N6-adenosine-specific RNA methylase IME4
MVRQKGLSERHYKVMSIEDLKALPVRGLTLPDSSLLMWTVSSHLDQAIALGVYWGFVYKAVAFTWVKTYKDGKPCFGLGKWTRLGSELCLLFTRGAPKRLSAGVSQVIISLRGGHSEKPLVAYERIEALLAGPYLELFARTRRPGWESWGDQLDLMPEAHATRHAASRGLDQRDLFGETR